MTIEKVLSSLEYVRVAQEISDAIEDRKTEVSRKESTISIGLATYLSMLGYYVDTDVPNCYIISWNAPSHY